VTLGAAARGKRAEGIGESARELGLETLALARVHEAALAALATPAGSRAGKGRLATRAESFFLAALAPIELSHAAATSARSECERLRTTLERSRRELGATRKRLAREVRRREASAEKLAPLRKENRRLIKQSAALERKRRALVRQLLTSQDEERKRISRDLHDALGQTLAGAHIALAKLASDSAARSNELRENVARTRRLVQRSMKTVHRFATELHPAVLDDLGLVPAIRSLTRERLGTGRTQLRFSSHGDLEGLGPSTNTALYRVVQEALTNAQRHARAKNVSVVLRRLESSVQVEISDDGRSFDVARMSRSRGKRTLGLLCMRERMETIGGTLAIESTPGVGTTVRAAIRLQERVDE
jgi:signal transduction histidine kinase